MKLRPITLLAAVAVAGLAAAGLVAWRHQSGSAVTTRPASLPIRYDAGGGASAAIALAPGSNGPGAVTYVAADGLARLDGTAHAWRLAPTPVSAATVAHLASALGLAGPVQASADGWTVSAADRVLTVSRAGSTSPWSWTMTGTAVSYASPGVVCAHPLIEPSGGTKGIAADPTTSVAGGSTAGPCQPPPTTLVPPTTTPPTAPLPADRAVTSARQILGRAGYDLSGWSVTATPSADPATVTASPVLDGLSVADDGLGSGVSALTLSFDPDGGVSSGSGGWVRPVEADAYPLIGTAAAVHALNQGHGLPGVEPMIGAAQPADSAPSDPSASSTSTTATSVNCDALAGADAPCGVAICPSIAPPPPGCPAGRAPTASTTVPESSSTVVAPSTTTVTEPPTVTPAPRQVRLDRAELVLVELVATDGATWSVPAYRFTSSTTPGTWTVLAIDQQWFDPGTGTTSNPGSGIGSGSGSPGGGAVTPGSSSDGSPPTTPIPPEGSTRTTTSTTSFATPVPGVPTLPGANRTEPTTG